MSQQIQIEKFQPSRQQQVFLNCVARHKALSGGFGSGKTTLNILQGLEYALANAGSRGMWVSRDHKMLRKSLVVQWEQWTREIELALGQSVVANYNKSEQRIDLVNGSVIWMGSAYDEESLYGADLAWFGADEVALWKKKAFDIMLDRLRQPGFEHRCWATYTPYGKGWWCDYFEEGKLAGAELFRISTGDNPAVSADYLDSLSDRYTGKWALQYIEGFPQEFEGLIWPGLVGCDYVGELPTAWKRVVGGMDWAWTAPSVLLLVGEDMAGGLWVFGEDWGTMRYVEDMVAAGRQLQDQFPVEVWYGDPSQPENIQKFCDAGLNAQPADNAVVPGIAAVDAAISRGMKVVDCPQLLAESYCWQQKPDGTFKQDQPRKEDDHCADALRYAIYSGFDQYRPAPDWVILW